MSDDLLRYYNLELAYLNELGREFAEAHEKVAGRLRLSGQGVEDPHVSRFIQSAAFLNARISRKLDDDFPELTTALFSVLSPNYLAPVPSMSVVQFDCDPSFGGRFAIPGETMLETDPVHGERCRYRTAYPVTVWPIKVSAAKLMRRPFEAPTAPSSNRAASVLRVQIAPLSTSMSIAALAPDRLRFFLDPRAHAQHAFRLYELFFNDVLDIAVATGPEDPRPALLPRKALQPVGFERHEGLLPYSHRSHIANRLMQEFFAFPFKFLFIDLGPLPAAKLAEAKGKLELYFFFRQLPNDLEAFVSAESFALGCTPVVNLFRRHAEPIQLVPTQSEYLVVPDARAPMWHEIYSIDRVTATSPAGESVPYLPLYGVEHGGEGPARPWYHASRVQSSEVAGRKTSGTEVFLRIVDLDGQPASPAEWTLSVETTCLNRGLPEELRAAPGGRQHGLGFAEGGGPVKHVRWMLTPTRTLPPPTKENAFWRLVSQLSLNHLSLVGGPDGSKALREILRTLEFTEESSNRALIDGLKEVQSEDSTMRVSSGGMPGWARGTKVTLTFDERKFTGSGVYLFAAVLERFLGLYAAVNSYVKLVAKTQQREGNGVLCEWNPRAGDKILV